MTISIINGKAVYGNNASSYWRTILVYNVDNNYSNTQAKITFSYGLHLSKELHKDHTYTKGYDTTYVTCTGQTKKTYNPSGTLTRSNTNQGDDIGYGSSYFLINKTTSTQTITLTAYIYHPKTYSGYIGKSTAKVSVTVSALPKYTVSFSANGGTGAPSSVTHYYGKTVKLPTTKPTRGGYAFTKWKDSDNRYYLAGATYPSVTRNTNTTLTAQWGATDPPTCDNSGITYSTSVEGTIIRGFTDVSCDISNIKTHSGREVDSITMQIGSVESSPRTTAGTLTISGTSFTKDDQGTQSVYINTKDRAGAEGHYVIGQVTVIAPTWTCDVEIDLPDPQVTKNNTAVVDTLRVYNYKNSEYDYVYIGDLDYAKTENGWKFKYTFDEDHVSKGTGGVLIEEPYVDVRVEYKHFDSIAGNARKAFYTTSRNQNYSNGIYNVMFVGGVDNALYPDYSSRVWWSAINDPLYFPDTNYSEVGSNDTTVVGLTKVGDYLAAIKQSKTTDTAIFLLYPTSFEEDTTFAVKQGVQGVGALARYSFNILGDETLFLSPNGVMAIAPSEDNEHKVLNRSYFVDKKLLAEPDIETSYSFVYDGKYFLSVGNGRVYVLDGNQRNSWGNDKTNLVYECYYLENVPAQCFMKYDGKLLFSDGDNVCMFGDSFFDAYDVVSGDENAPVFAEWSTILDDDGALHYYKNMQKKGNLVSILPMENESGFKQVYVDEDTFNADKTLYYTLDDGEYTQCTSESVYSEGQVYYVVNVSSTKVFVRKDNDDPVEIKRKFNPSTSIPSELYIKKKFKKYKRLQFIIQNDADEDFGVDCIIKNYSVGNYAKK